MNKTAIRKFAEWAREKLIEDIKYKAGTVGITENGIAEKLPQSTSDTYFYDVGTKDYTKISGIEIKQRDALVKAIQTKERSYKSYQEAFENVIEEVAYTWFNRLIAIRFMEVNDYLPSGVRVLSSENKAKKEPDLVTTPFDTDLEFTSYEQDRIIQLKDDNKLDELFRMLFIKQCNKLHDILPELFEKTDDYSELLLTISFTDPEGIIHHLINDIEDADFRINDEMYTDDGKIKADGQVEIIGWLYQYYISKKHDEIVNIYKGKVKKADIPAATQLFTTDWVVRYMVDNSLGRYWIERNPQSKLAEKLEFFVTPKNGEIQYVDEKIRPTDLTFFDPCMGSGHILVYAFDVLMEIYREVGYSDRDAALSIVENNLFGMDIDKRAYQLAYFAVMMKARSYNRRALTKGISNNLAVVEESNSIDKFVCGGLTPEVEDKDVTVRKADLQRDIKSLISYAVGCMFGRYSLEREGIVYAGGNFDDVYWKYKGQAALDKNGEPIEGGYAGISLANYHYPKLHDTDDWKTATELSFEPDADNCIPITDEEYFEDDIVGLFCAWLKKVYGEDTLEENLDFIANALGNKGKTSREVIRNYFLTDFIKDHIKTYHKRPIYWLFDSGKQNGFKALVYMHRWNADTIGNVRVEYLHRIQRVYEKEIIRMQEIIDNSHDNKEISNATKRKEKLQKQIKETKDYDAKIAHLALSRIDIDLDDGVKVNYEKVQTADGKKMRILAKI